MANSTQTASIRERAAQLLSGAIRFRTENPPGDEAPLADYFVAALRSAGVEARSITTPSQGGRRAAVWARVRGSGRGRPVVLLSHLDVVPADPDEWGLDPFAGRIAGGYVHGRGALDAKGVAVVHALTLMELVRRATTLDRDVILLSTPDEEMGGRAGAGYLVRERPELLADAEYLLTEGGGIRSGRAAGGGDREVWEVAIGEKTPCWLELVARGTAGHSAAPDRDAAVPRLVAALDRVRRMESALRVVPEVERMFRALAPAAAEEDRAGFAHLRDALSKDASFRRRFLANRGHNALVRNTHSITVLEGGPRTNVAPAEARAHIDARLLPGERCTAFRERLRTAIGDTQIGVTTLLSFAAGVSPIDTLLFRAIENVAHDGAAGALVVPRLIAGFTDAHWFRERGIVAYGFVPRWLSASEAGGVHGSNERISLDNLERGVGVLGRILEALSLP